ncbi:hypothetical protein RQP46_002556 [Phenoliferia psychrophenolica]
MGIVVWMLRAADLGDLDREDDEEDWNEEEEERIEREVQDDVFLNLRLLDVLLPPEAKTKEQRRLRDDYIVWGSLQYQSLMLERSVVMSALVGALAETQKVEVEDRKREEAAWKKKLEKHNWETGGPLEKDEWVGVRGVLVVDNDAVWLSSPSSFLAHPYRPSGTHPSILFAADSAPDFTNAWGTYSLPCACFFYARTSDHLSHTASSLPPHLADSYRPSSDAAHVWRTTALCHIAMLLRELATGRRQAEQLFDPTTAIESLDQDHQKNSSRFYRKQDSIPTAEERPVSTSLAVGIGISAPTPLSTLRLLEETRMGDIER